MGVQQSKDELLYKEVQNGNIDAVKELHRAGASLEWIDKEGRTPLILACTRSDLHNMVTVLLELGANLDYYRPGSHNGTPLHHAAKRGHSKTVMQLLSHGANPLALNDDCQTPLEIARAKGYVNVVRIIEGHISTFSGTVRELSGPSFLGALAPQLVSRKIWAVVLPSALYRKHQTPKFDLVLYATPKVAQPRNIISLSKIDIEEPKFGSSDPVLVLFDKITKNKYRFLSENEGDKEQLKRLYIACKGTPQKMQKDSNTKTQSENISLLEDQELAMAISASLQSASQEGIMPPASQQAMHPMSDLNGWGSTQSSSSSSVMSSKRTNMQSDNNKFAGWSDDVGLTSHSGWGAGNAPPERRICETSNEFTFPKPSTDTAMAHTSSLVSTPSAPPLPAEYMTCSYAEPVVHPSVDNSPTHIDMSIPASHVSQPANCSMTSSPSSGACVICWDAPAEAVCIPCGHVAGCAACLNEIKAKNIGCPVCRTSIEQVIKVYMV